MPELKERATGMLFIRHTGVKQDSRKVVMVFGLLALPEGFELKGEHQYVTVGAAPDADMLQLTRFGDHAVDRTEEAKGMGPDGLLTMPIWRT